MNTSLDFMYNGNDPRDKRIFEGLNYEGPKVFSHGDWHTVAKLEADAESDGQNCEIQECRLPARFFRLLVHPTPNSVGKTQEGWILSTGSGDEGGAAIVRVAKLVVQGMIGWHPYSQKDRI